MTTPALIDLDAARREGEYPEGIPVRFGGKDYMLPSELPIDVFDPFLSEDLDLIGLLKPIFAATENRADDKSIGDLVIDTLTTRPALPKEFIGAIQDSLALLFGADQFAAFSADRPGVGDYLRLIRGLVKAYGVTLGEAFASPASSENGGATQSQTSTASTESTPAPSGDPAVVIPEPTPESVPADPQTPAPVPAPVVEPAPLPPLAS
jgi:hypothetical protein